MNRINAGRWLRQALVVAFGLQVALASASSHRSPSGWLTFEYPDGWEAIETETTRARYVENVGLQPKGQDFVGRDGQFALRVFDPLYVYDEVLLPDGTTAESVFQKFVRGLPGEADARFSKESDGSTTFFVARSTLDGVQKVFFARRSPNGHLMVTGGAAAKASSAQLERYVLELLQSMRFAAPAGTNMGPANSVAAWYSAMGKGDSAAARALTCANAKYLGDLLGMLTDNPSTSEISEAIIQAQRAFDRSGLRFFPLTYREEIASVRVVGPVKFPNGKVVPFYRSAQTFGSNVLIVRKEASGWKVCEALRRQK